MTTILESTTAGIAYLRGGALVRCNRRFEAMLQLPPSAVAGSSLAELLSRHPDAENAAAEVREALMADLIYETEFAFDGVDAASSSGDLDDGSGAPRPGLRWYSLSVRACRRRDRLRRGDRRAVRHHPAQVAAAPARGARARARADGRAHTLDPRLGAGRHRHRRQPRHRVDEPLGAAHVRRRAGRLHRRADGDRGDGRGRASVAPHRTTSTSSPKARPRPSSAASRRATGASSGSSATPSPPGATATGRQLTFALLDIERRRQAEAAMSRRRRRRCGASSRRRRWRSALLDAGTLRMLQVNAVAAAFGAAARADALLGRTPRGASSPADVAAARRRDMRAALAASEATTREYRIAVGGSESRLGRPLRAARHARRRSAGPAAGRRQRRDRAARRAGGAPRGRDRAARDAGARSAPPHQEQPAGRRRPAAADRASASPRSAAAIAEVVGQVQAIAQVYGLQVGCGGPLRVVERPRGDHRLGAAHVRPADRVPGRRRATRRRGRCPRPRRSRSR